MKIWALIILLGVSFAAGAIILAALAAGARADARRRRLFESKSQPSQPPKPPDDPPT